LRLSCKTHYQLWVKLRLRTLLIESHDINRRQHTAFLAAIWLLIQAWCLVIEIPQTLLSHRLAALQKGSLKL
jgi:uncharacterized membrane protein